ncbi:hypothetical protein C7999DRAFT_17321 [Corynascus novoguineensis]|uniref:Uncharacterized protein n=1 Tax=Corynascus novoguineensis TaxID=1126955 RepID=A0AAN7HGE2_9PEZI|nr:hypothetical protein C7999DRAFT_17321 [Corynascus novoguineensis]
MPLRINISDVAIEKHEAIHQLHVWGVKTSRWKNNCIHQCAYFQRTPLSSRPSPNHRRAAVLHSGSPVVDLVWAEIKDDHLVIDHPSFHDCFGYPGIGCSWLELAVINPAVEHESFKKIGHGLAMGFSPTLMDPDSVVDTKWRNLALSDILGPGHKALFPGPLVFFSYGYDMSDYVKIDPTKSDTLRYRHDRLRASGLYGPGKESGTPIECQATNSGNKYVWKWKVKERGTSMKVLDLTRRDFSVLLDYTSHSQLNPIPCSSLITGNSFVDAVHVQDLNHSGYKLPHLWVMEDSAARLIASNIPGGAVTEQTGRGDNISFYYMGLPEQPKPLHAMLGAFAVGLPWLVHYSMDVNPPFRGHVPPATRWPLADLMWAVDFRDHDYVGRVATDCAMEPDTDEGAKFQRQQQEQQPSRRRGDERNLLRIYRPTMACDSLTVVHALAGDDAKGAGQRLAADHVRALYKYLRRTPPSRWSRHGAEGFENYWHVYARVHHLGDTSRTATTAESPYAITRRLEEKLELEEVRKREKGETKRSSSSPPPDCRDLLIARMLAHMTLERLTGEDAVQSKGQRARIERRRWAILRVIEWYRTKGPGRDKDPVANGGI